MPDTKKLRNRIRSVQSTLHLTHAMELVASSKIRRANAAMDASGDHAAAFRKAMDALSASDACAHSPWMRKDGEGKTLLIVIAGDRGLAGGYNANIFRFMRDWPEASAPATATAPATRTPACWWRATPRPGPTTWPRASASALSAGS